MYFYKKSEVMQTLSIDILNPKAYNLINELEQLELIKINSKTEEYDPFELTQEDYTALAKAKEEKEQGLGIPHTQVMKEMFELCTK